jgi:hypothetical protein
VKKKTVGCQRLPDRGRLAHLRPIPSLKGEETGSKYLR